MKIRLNAYFPWTQSSTSSGLTLLKYFYSVRDEKIIICLSFKTFSFHLCMKNTWTMIAKVLMLIQNCFSGSLPRLKNETYTSLSDVLILSTNTPDTVPVITNSNGRSDKNFFFMFDEGTEVLAACSLTWRGEHYVFGGELNKNQISRISDCQLKSVGQIQFPLWHGSCTNVADQFIYLCFSDTAGDGQRCRKSSNPTGQYQEVRSSVYEHRSILIASNTCKIVLLNASRCKTAFRWYPRSGKPQSIQQEKWDLEHATRFLASNCGLSSRNRSKFMILVVKNQIWI